MKKANYSSGYKLKRPDVKLPYPWKELMAYGRGKDLKPSKVEQLTYFYLDYEIPDKGLGKPQMESIFKQWLKDQVSDSIVKKWCDLSFNKADKDNSGYINLLEFIDIYVSDLRTELEKYVAEDDALGVSNAGDDAITPTATPDRKNSPPDNVTPFPTRQSFNNKEEGNYFFDIQSQGTSNLESRPEDEEQKKKEEGESNNTDHLFHRNEEENGNNTGVEKDYLTGISNGNDGLTGVGNGETPFIGKDNNGEAPNNSLTGQENGHVEIPTESLSGKDENDNKSSLTPEEWRNLSENERKVLQEAYIRNAAYYISIKEPHTDQHSCWVKGEKEILSKFPFMCVVDRAT